VDRELIRAFVSRDFERAAEEKRRFWAERYQAEGPECTLRASDALREHLRSVDPSWPSASDRAADLACHVAMCQLFERVNVGLARR